MLPINLLYLWTNREQLQQQQMTHRHRDNMPFQHKNSGLYWISKIIYWKLPYSNHFALLFSRLFKKKNEPIDAHKPVKDGHQRTNSRADLPQCDKVWSVKGRNGRKMERRESLGSWIAAFLLHLLQTGAKWDFKTQRDKTTKERLRNLHGRIFKK